ncbi:glycoside hydrolase family 3 C-terminal domain-containing protein [Paenibacillus sp. GSMTC-2017]|uniref:glycoside hydrolase family 3 C-terminal domain-containing protein n=1 Tax=Paenibacillus sp. GSMTC-2017 TaxID=2794350 RepID=UPI0018D7E070|nr:glycoside hydrolase family 3 C-terminal domain-containing protein [Paenibacillus sp. GSMTC-2017]MBH5319439.1 glycoside hydrolase family 3 C-terminal domain-containing protein [Paenibacillus sp. GSMTC-2017]
MKYKSLIESMTLEEKASLMSGANFWNTKAIERLNIPSIMLTDGPHGLRKQGGKADHLGLNKSLPATCFPTAATLANSWDRGLIYDVGQTIGREAASEKVSVLLGPGLNIKRNPLCGRNFEYFSEDPYLTGELASEMVKGIQSNGIAACPKHFAVNSQEHMRMTIDEVVDERSLRELYLEGFRRVVEKSKPKTIMTSYNRVNGTFANENNYLLQDILNGEWGFDGVVVTDWGGNNDRVAGLKAGNQLEMPSTNGITDKEIVQAVRNKELAEGVLDEAVDRLLELVYTTQLHDRDASHIDYEEHHNEAVDAAKRSIVLLKNDDNILPLARNNKVAIIGDFARNPRYQGAGSSLINPAKLSNAVDVLNQSGLSIVGHTKGFKRMGGADNGLLREAVTLAAQADTVLLFLGLDEGSEAEGIDRVNLSLRENQLDLLRSLTKVNSNIVVILAGGGAIEMPFVHDVKAIVHTYLSGQGSAEALASILLGEYNPSGKLSETFPIAYGDVSSAPYYPGKEATAEHIEGIFIGYRYFDTAQKPVLFPFGYGLSYTTFAYSDLAVDQYQASFTITNTGSVAGEEVAQLYIQKQNSSIFRAKRELKGFEKVFLEPAESKRVTIMLEEHDFAYFNPTAHRWVVEPGAYDIQIGSSIQSIHLNEEITLEGDSIPSDHTKENFPHYFSGQVHKVTAVEYKRLLGYEPPAPYWDPKQDLGLNDTIAQARYKNLLGKSIYHVVFFFKRFFDAVNKPLLANNVYFVLNMPFRQIDRFTGGKISRKQILKVLKWINR